MRILRPVVEALLLAMLDIHARPGPGRAVGTELVGDHHARCAGLLSYQLAQELLRCAPALTALNQSVKNEAVSLDGAPQPTHLAVDRDHDRAASRSSTIRRLSGKRTESQTGTSFSIGLSWSWLLGRAGLFQHKRPRAEVVFYAASAFFGRPTCPSRSMRSAGPSGNRATISRLPPAAST